MLLTVSLLCLDHYRTTKTEESAVLTCAAGKRGLEVGTCGPIAAGEEVVAADWDAATPGNPGPAASIGGTKPLKTILCP